MAFPLAIGSTIPIAAQNAIDFSTLKNDVTTELGKLDHFS